MGVGIRYRPPPPRRGAAVAATGQTFTPDGRLCISRNQERVHVVSEAAAVAVTAELRTQDGRFVRFDDDLAGELCAINEGSIEDLGCVTMAGNTFTNLRAGISVHADGTVAVGVS